MTKLNPEQSSARYVGNASKDARYGSCVCYTPGRIREARERGQDKPSILPECGYHQVAAEFPNDHSVPWNCPTYWDGCNCDDPEYTA